MTTMTTNLCDSEEFVGQNACKQFSTELRGALEVCSRSDFGLPKPARATLKNGLRLLLGPTTPDFSGWVRENKEFLVTVEKFWEGRGWVVCWSDGQWQ